jgi:formylglycine-generating enzyme required for sulfatase activity
MFRRIQLSAFIALAGMAVLVACEKKQAVPPQPKTTPVDVKTPAAKHQSYTESLDGPEGKITFEMVAVPGGEFLMGSPKNEADRKDDEGPQVKAKLKPFWIGKCEVSWDEFDLYFRVGNANLKEDGEEEKKDEPKKDNKPLSAADAVSKPTKPYVDETYGFEREKHPAICMTHHAALKYCEWLSKKTGKDYRLPTEAEWEYACRAGSNTPHAIPAGAKLDEYAWFKGNSGIEARPAGAPHAVGSKKPNAWGIHDMHGNVMEWCMDHYVPDAYTRFEKLATGGLVSSPMYKPTENKWRHTARGGHFKDTPVDLRSAARRKSDVKWMSADPQEPQSIWWLTNYPIIGFRVVRPLEPDELTGITSKVVKENNEEFKP